MSVQNTSKKLGRVENLTNAGKGRPKGSPNKSTATMKEAIQAVYEKLQTDHGGDHAHFKEWAEAQPTEFYKIASKLLPMQVEASVSVTLADRLLRARKNG